ncbi:hypothetical protein BN341_16490 [Helicobacter heilmannii ASB1.4]|uniref:Uncharacterized protein n=1 Tax=Helicobacter heilmannii TaxID=35817 RepID=A0A0K2YE29_HELHE|nr:hypothetical protein BN341_16490 [Helicobacter heilmannii ASB1.4]CRI35220.1 hypothetical protein HHE01_02180 [Helicobacter heilmannii]
MKHIITTLYNLSDPIDPTKLAHALQSLMGFLLEEHTSCPI